MNISVSKTTDVTSQIQRMQQLLEKQKQSFSKDTMPSANERIERLNSLRKILLKYQDDICSAISDDFGNRSVYESKIGEIGTCLGHIAYYSKNVAKWMKPSKRHVSAIHQPSKAWVQYQPLGVVGIIAPWNYPLFLSIGPLICALAAGNRAMIKMSRSSPRLGVLLDRILAEVFADDIVAVVNGGGPISDAFSHLDFDQITFTGSPSVGKIVMKAAAENLTPVLLELGGKSPVIVHDSIALDDVAERLTFGKFWNAGQTCVAPDYLFLPQGKTKNFIESMKKYIRKSYPTLLNNVDYTSIVNEAQYDRLQKALADAVSKGAQIVEVNPANEDLSGTRKIAPTFIFNVNDDMIVCQEELFGPILVIKEYHHIDDAVEYVNAKPRPLALYYFDFDSKRAEEMNKRTLSGHFGINAVVTHFAQDDLPVGGVGNSGMGKYHGFEGFMAMSNAKSVMSKSRFYALKMILPPFGQTSHKLALKLLMR